uniref:Uncharacterized protein n=1 Tax=Eutreptiella gymnastica TaxID=73025 RepID=A0A7S1N714_9EUGL
MPTFRLLVQCRRSILYSVSKPGLASRQLERRYGLGSHHGWCVPPNISFDRLHHTVFSAIFHPTHKVVCDTVKTGTEENSPYFGTQCNGTYRNLHLGSRGVSSDTFLG